MIDVKLFKFTKMNDGHKIQWLINLYVMMITETMITLFPSLKNCIYNTVRSPRDMK